MQLEISEHQAKIIKGLLEYHIKIADDKLKLDNFSSIDDLHLVKTGNKLMKELVRQIDKKLDAQKKEQL